MRRKPKPSPVPDLYLGFIDFRDEPRLLALTEAFRLMERHHNDYKKALSAVLEARGWLNDSDLDELARRHDWFDHTCVQLYAVRAELLKAHKAMAAPYDVVAQVVVWKNGEPFADELQQAVAVRNCLCVKDLDASLRQTFARTPEYVTIGDVSERYRMRIPTYFKDRAGEGLKAQ